MASQRALTADEVARLRARFLPKQKWSLRDLKLLVVPLAGAVVSTPVAILFFCAARFMHGEELAEALRIGALGFLPGVGFGLIILVMGLFGGIRPALPSLPAELAKGVCDVRVHRAVRWWHLVDAGNVDDPDLLLDLGRDRVLAVGAHYLGRPIDVREVCTIEVLPRSNVIVSIAFTGDAIPSAGAPVVTENLWRHDDLPSHEPISLASTLPELRAAIERSRESS